MKPILIYSPSEQTSVLKLFIDIGIPLGAAFIGAIIGGLFALIAGTQAHGYNLKHASIQKQQHIDGVLLAIRNELEVLKKYYSASSGANLEKIKEGENYNIYFSLRQQYFIVYPNNTDIIGQIQDAELVKSIISTYNTGNFLIESYLINNWYIDMEKTTQGLLQSREVWNRAAHTSSLKVLHATLYRETDALMAKIEAYRASHPIIAK